MQPDWHIDLLKYLHWRKETVQNLPLDPEHSLSGRLVEVCLDFRKAARALRRAPNSICKSWRKNVLQMQINQHELTFRKDPPFLKK